MDDIAQSKLRGDIVELMREMARTHHKAYLGANRENNEWPIWYANYLWLRLGQLLAKEFTISQLAYCLITFEYERKVVDPDADWPTYYVHIQKL